jgi:retinol dehydrogenase 14
VGEINMTNPTPSTSRTALIIGGTSGIGRSAALLFAKRGFDVIFVGRNAQAGETLRAEIQRSGQRGVFIQADMSLMKEVRRVAGEVHQHTTALHAVAHTADVIINKRLSTAEGVELSFATNYLSRFLLNQVILDLLKAGAPSRILHVAAPGMPFPFDPANVPPPPAMSSFTGHNIGQGANSLYGVEMAARLQGSGVSINVMNPGMVDTDIRRRSTDMPPLFKIFGSIMGVLLKSRTLTPDQSGAVVVDVLTAPQYADWNGKFVGPKGEAYKQRPADLDVARRKIVWDNSERAVAAAEGHATDTIRQTNAGR